jgi:hypothetical protein
VVCEQAGREISPPNGEDALIAVLRLPWAIACAEVEHRAKIPLEIVIDGESVRSETRLSSVGAYVVVLDTVLADRATDLHSVYLGHPKTMTQATHLLLTPELHESLTVEHEHDAIPVMHARRNCLYEAVA